jgi:hypothetical protein
MKKYIIGAVFGFIFATAFSAHAEVVNLINQTVQGLFPVSVDGKNIGNAIVVDNKTYLPVRDFGEAVGYKVTFTEDRQVVLTKEDDTAQTMPQQPQTTTPTQQQSEQTKESKIESLNDKINQLKINIQILTASVNQAEKSENKPAYYEKEKQELADAQKKLADLQKQLDDLQKQ